MVMLRSMGRKTIFCAALKKTKQKVAKKNMSDGSLTELTRSILEPDSPLKL